MPYYTVPRTHHFVRCAAQMHPILCVYIIIMRINIVRIIESSNMPLRGVLNQRKNRFYYIL